MYQGSANSSVLIYFKENCCYNKFDAAFPFSQAMTNTRNNAHQTT